MGKGRTVPGSLRDREAQNCMKAMMTPVDKDKFDDMWMFDTIDGRKIMAMKPLWVDKKPSGVEKKKPSGVENKKK